MSKAHAPELKKFLDRRLGVKLNSNRSVFGLLRGFDPFMNLVMDETVQGFGDGGNVIIGLVVIRGSSVLMMDAAQSHDQMFLNN